MFDMESDMILCFLCFKKFNCTKSVALHLKVSHSICSGDSVPCKQPGCTRKFSDVWSFKKHLERKHNFSSSVLTVESHSKRNDEVNENNILPSPSSFSGSVSSQGTDVFKTQTLDENFLLEDVVNTIGSSAVSLCAKLYENPAIPRNQVQFVIDSVTDFLNCGAISMISQNLKTLHQEQSASSMNEIVKMLTVLENPFKELSTEKRRFDYFQRSSFLIKPISFIVGYTEQCRTFSDRSCLQLEAMSAHYVPLQLVLKNFFELPEVLDVVLSRVEECKKESPTVSSFLQSKLWTEMALKFPGKVVLPVILYHDDFEVNNPLGSHAGIHKLGGTYFTIPALPLENSSTLDNIFLAQLSHSSDRSQFGNRAIFQNLLKELKFLESDGITVSVNGEDVKLYFTLALILGDNLGMNGILGFVESFSGNYFCRICTADKQQTQTLCKSIPELKRTFHNFPIQNTNLENKGIKGECIWDDLTAYKVNENIACDVMHDVFEGICRYEIGKILHYFINEKQFTLGTLNERIKYFKYGQYDSNKPALITLDQIRKKYIIMSTSEMACLTRYLGCIIGDKIPEGHQVWKLYLLLKKIIELCMSRNVTSEKAALLKHLIQEHHETYIHLFQEPLKPKHHFLTHYPDIMLNIGPLVHMSSMRFEAKHRDFKKNSSVVSSRVNITFTLALKNQLRLCHRFFSKKGIVRDLVFSPEQMDGVYSYVICNGTKYEPGAVLLTAVDSILPEFSVIRSVYCEKDADITFFVQQLQNNGYNEHIDAYLVEENTDFETVKINYTDLPDVFPTSGLLTYGGTGEKVICFR